MGGGGQINFLLLKEGLHIEGGGGYLRWGGKELNSKFTVCCSLDNCHIVTPAYCPSIQQVHFINGWQ